MDEEAGAELGLKPSALGWHDLIGVADRHQLLHRDGEHGESHVVRTAVDQFFQLLRPTDAADEVDPLAGAWVVDAENGIEKAVLKDADVEDIDRAGIGVGLPLEEVPLAPEVHAALAGLGGDLLLGGVDREDLAHLGQEGRFIQAVEIFDSTVVGQDVQLVAGEKDAEEPIVVFRTVVLRIGLAAFLAHAEGAGRAVVTIGHVGAGDLGVKKGGQLRAGLRVQFPGLVHHAVGRGEVVGWFCGGEMPLNDLVDGGLSTIGQENGAGVGAECVHQTGAVVLFVGAGLLMLFDEIVLVVLDVTDGHEARLLVLADDLAVQVHGRLRLADQGSGGLELVQVLQGARIHRVRVRIDLWIQLEFRAIHAKERMGLAFRKGGGFLTIHHVVRDGGDFGGEFGGWDETLKRSDAHRWMGRAKTLGRWPRLSNWKGSQIRGNRDDCVEEAGRGEIGSPQRRRARNPRVSDAPMGALRGGSLGQGDGHEFHRLRLEVRGKIAVSI